MGKANGKQANGKQANGIRATSLLLLLTGPLMTYYSIAYHLAAFTWLGLATTALGMLLTVLRS